PQKTGQFSIDRYRVWTQRRSSKICPPYSQSDFHSSPLIRRGSSDRASARSITSDHDVRSNCSILPSPNRDHRPALFRPGSDSAPAFDPRGDDRVFADGVAAVHAACQAGLAGGLQKIADLGKEVARDRRMEDRKMEDRKWETGK